MSLTDTCRAAKRPVDRIDDGRFVDRIGPWGYKVLRVKVVK